MDAQEFIDRVRFEIETHAHEGWQLQESAMGGWYCAACGGSVDNVDAQKLGKPPLDSAQRRPALGTRGREARNVNDPDHPNREKIPCLKP